MGPEVNHVASSPAFAVVVSGLLQDLLTQRLERQPFC